MKTYTLTLEAKKEIFINFKIPLIHLDFHLKNTSDCDFITAVIFYKNDKKL